MAINIILTTASSDNKRYTAHGEQSRSLFVKVFFSTNQEIGWAECLRNDPFRVNWVVGHKIFTQMPRKNIHKSFLHFAIGYYVKKQQR